MPFFESSFAQITDIIGVHAMRSGARGQSDEMEFSTATDLGEKRTARPERFVVGMGEDSKNDLLHSSSILGDNDRRNSFD